MGTKLKVRAVAATLLLAGAAHAGEHQDRAADLCAWLDSHNQDIGAFGFCATYRGMSESVIEGRIKDFLQDMQNTYGLDQRQALQSELDRKTAGRAGKVAAEEAARQAARAKLLANIQSTTDSQVCEFLHADDSFAVASGEALRRKLFVAKDIDRIKVRAVGIGMSEKAMLCALGAPKDINRTVNAAGEHKQYVYGGLLVYTDNGVVTSYQD